jgi:hypothetical protein
MNWDTEQVVFWTRTKVMYNMSGELSLMGKIEKKI